MLQLKACFSFACVTEPQVGKVGPTGVQVLSSQYLEENQCHSGHVRQFQIVMLLVLGPGAA